MSTEKQIEANRRNAQLSTGPKTPEGKATSSLNGLKHGLTSAQVLAPSESADEFDAHAAAFRDQLAPTSHVEKCLVEQIIVAVWRGLSARSRGFHQDPQAGSRGTNTDFALWRRLAARSRGFH